MTATSSGISANQPPGPVGPEVPVRLRAAVGWTVLLAMGGALVGMGLMPSNRALGAAGGAGAMFLLCAALLAAVDWRRGLALLAGVLLLEDSLRKAMPGAPGWVNVLKDVVVLNAYLSYFFSPLARHLRQQQPTDFRAKVWLPIGIWIGFVVVQMANPGISHPLVAVSGLRTWALYIPLAFLIADLMSDDARVLRIATGIALLAIPFLGVALLQNWYGHELPTFLRDGVFQQSHGLEGGGWLGYNESVFASPTLYALVSVLQLCVAVGVLRSGVPKRSTRTLLWVAGYCAIAGAYLSGVRTGLTLAALAVAAMLPLVVLTPRVVTEKGKSLRRSVLASGGIMGLVIGVLLISSMGELRRQAFWSSFSFEILSKRIEFANSAVSITRVGTFGKGTGSAGASGRVMSLLGQPSGSNESVEWGGAVISYSYGTVGLIVAALCAIWLLGGLFSLATENRRARFMPLRYALFIYVGAQLSWYYFKAFPVLENPTMALLFWGSIGAILGLARRDRQAQAAGSTA